MKRPTDRQKLGAQFRKRREWMELFQGTAGALADPPLLQKTVSNIETGTGNPTLDSLLAYAEAMGCELVLRGWTSPKAKRQK